jgi:hypothetical protein
MEENHIRTLTFCTKKIATALITHKGKKYLILVLSFKYNNKHNKFSDK